MNRSMNAVKRDVNMPKNDHEKLVNQMPIFQGLIRGFDKRPPPPFTQQQQFRPPPPPFTPQQQQQQQKKPKQPRVPGSITINHFDFYYPDKVTSSTKTPSKGKFFFTIFFVSKRIIIFSNYRERKGRKKTF
jgi:hypothetical protein